MSLAAVPGEMRPGMSVPAGLAVGLGVGSLAYRIALEEMVQRSWITPYGDYSAAVRVDLLDYGPWVLLALGVVLFGVAWSLGGRARLDRSLAGFVLVAAGVAWFLISLAEMLVLEAYDWPHEGLAKLWRDVAYHGLGVAIAALGWALVRAPRGRDRSMVSARGGQASRPI